MFIFFLLFLIFFLIILIFILGSSKIFLSDTHLTNYLPMATWHIQSSNDSTTSERFSEHRPILGTWRRCAHCNTPKRQKRSKIICAKCNVALCKNCFLPYHNSFLF